LEEAKNSGKSSQSQAESSYGQSIDNQSITYWNNLSSTQSAEMQIMLMAENLTQAESVLEDAKEALEETQEALQDYKFYAPYDGLVFDSDFRVGEHESSSSLMNLISDDFIARVTVSENDIFKISEGIEAVITLDAYTGIELPGEVEEIIPISVNDGGVTSYEVLIRFEYGQNIDIYHGLSANASIITLKAEDVLYVPIQAVYKEGGKSFVDLLTTFGVEPENILEAVEQTEINTGINDYQYIEVISGLEEGDIIVTSRIR
jgi:HlyD family secretion protein